MTAVSSGETAPAEPIDGGPPPETIGPAAGEDGQAAAGPIGGSSGPPGTPSDDASVIRGMKAVWASPSGARCRPEFAAPSWASDVPITR
jgi:hypothetical protein